MSIVKFGPVDAAALLTRAYGKYYVAFPYSPTLFTDMARMDSVDLALSRVLMVEGQPVAIALIARRGWTSRLASIVVPELRRHGHGRALLHQLLDEAAGRGDRSMVTEVIEQNLPAVSLYERNGFKRLRRLVGYAGHWADFGSPANPREIDPREFGRLLQCHGPADLPWQISGETLAQLSPGHTAWQYDGAAILLSATEAPVITIRGLLPDSDGADNAVALIQALMMRFPNRDWSVQTIFPEEWGFIFERAGLERTSLSQLQMVTQINGQA